MASNTREVVFDLTPLLKVYKDGTVERISSSPHVPPSPEDLGAGVVSKDVTIKPGLSARLYRPKMGEPNKKLPILVYFHGGGFCVGSAFSFLDHRYMNLLASEAECLIVSVEYRLAPEHPLPTGYEDSWDALKWVTSHVCENANMEKEPWLTNHADFGKLFIGGDSAGGNIAHNIAIRAGKEPLPCDVKILGAFLSHPHFWGSNQLKSTPNENVEFSLLLSRIWEFVYPSAPGGIDNPLINPFADDAPSLSALGCRKLFVCLAEKDVLTERGKLYVETLKKSGWNGEVELVEVEGEDHCFHVFDPENEKAKNLIKRLANFISQ